MVMPHDLFFPPGLDVPEDRSHNDHRSSSLAAWYVISSTKSPDRSQKATLPTHCKAGEVGKAPRAIPAAHDGQQVALWPRFNKDSGKVERRGESRKKN